MGRVKIRFWGVRGSVPAPGRTTARFGGNTSCIEIQDGPTHIICDAGTGIRSLGLALQRAAGRRPISATILISHVHWDHYIGLPFFEPLHARRNCFVIAGPGWRGRAFKAILGAGVRPPYFPVRLEDLGARISLQTVGPRAFRINDVRVTPISARHPDEALGWRLDFCSGRSIAILSDNEPADARRDLALIEWMAGADLLVHDAQYSPAEYERKRGWGHSPFTYPLGLACAAEVPRVILTHFDPQARDAQLSSMSRKAAQYLRQRRCRTRCELAREGLSLQI